MHYDLLTADWPLSLWAPLAFAVLGAVVAGCQFVPIIRRWQAVIHARARNLVGRLFGSGATMVCCGCAMIVVATLVLSTTYPDYLRQERAYRGGNYRTTEGVVEVLRLEPKGGHAPGDLIRVGNISYEISYWVGWGGYHKSLAHGGILRQGSRVRLLDVDGTIVRIEVSE